MESYLSGLLEGEIVEQAAPNATLRTLALVLLKEGQRTEYPNGNLTITANSSGSPRVDMIQWDGKTLAVLAGTPNGNPQAPSPSANNVPVALVYVPNAFSTVRSFGFVESGVAQARIIGFYHAISGLYAWMGSTASQQTNAIAGTEFTTFRLPVYIPRLGARWQYSMSAFINLDAAASNGAKIIPVIEGGLTGFDLIDGVDGLRYDNAALNDGLRFGATWMRATPGFTSPRFSLSFGPQVDANNVTVSTVRLSLREVR
jgi:hypothetical protein